MFRTCTRVFSSLVFLVTSLLCSCATHTGSIGSTEAVVKDWNGLIDEVEVLTPFQLNQYSQVMVAKLDTSGTPLPPADDNTYEPVNVVLKSASEIFTNALRKEAKAPLKVVGPVESLKEAGPRTLLITGKVTRMEPGSQALRYFVGFGAGKTVVEVTGEVLDGASNKPLLKFKHAKASGIGVFGGDYTNFLTDDMHDVGGDVGKMLLYFSKAQ